MSLQLTIIESNRKGTHHDNSRDIIQCASMYLLEAQYFIRKARQGTLFPYHYEASLLNIKDVYSNFLVFKNYEMNQ